MLERIHTIDDLWNISHHTDGWDKQFELIEGKLYEMPLNGWLHGVIVANVSWLITRYVNQHQLGDITAAGTGYILNQQEKDTVLAPDVGFIPAHRIPATIPDEGYVPFAPDFAVEVVSPGNTTEEMDLKIEAYMRYRTRLLWVLYPKQKKVLICRPNPNETGTFTGKFVGIDDTLGGGDVLPGFSVAVRDIFGK